MTWTSQLWTLLCKQSILASTVVMTRAWSVTLLSILSDPLVLGFEVTLAQLDEFWLPSGVVPIVRRCVLCTNLRARILWDASDTRPYIGKLNSASFFLDFFCATLLNGCLSNMSSKVCWTWQHVWVGPWTFFVERCSNEWGAVVTSWSLMLWVVECSFRQNHEG